MGLGRCWTVGRCWLCLTARVAEEEHQWTTHCESNASRDLYGMMSHAGCCARMRWCRAGCGSCVLCISRATAVSVEPGFIQILQLRRCAVLMCVTLPCWVQMSGVSALILTLRCDAGELCCCMSACLSDGVDRMQMSVFGVLSFLLWVLGSGL